MEEVYRARDLRLQRTVALKILPETVATDDNRLARFTREAQTLAALNHPNIAAIYGIEDSGPVHAIAMELVDGEDLSQRLARGPLPLDEVLPIARQLAEALETAHDAGVVHRDLKPANVMVRGDGGFAGSTTGLKLLILRYGEMSVWLKEHAWKSTSAARADAHQNPPTHFRSTVSRNNDLS